MPNVLPSKAASHYLDAIGAAAIYIALPRIGAASVRGLQRLPRDVGDIQWMVWVRDLAIAKTVADPELIWVQRDDGVKQCRVLLDNFGDRLDDPFRRWLAIEPANFERMGNGGRQPGPPRLFTCGEPLGAVALLPRLV